MKRQKKQNKGYIFTGLLKVLLLFLAFVYLISQAKGSGIVKKMVPAKSVNAPKTIKLEQTVKYVTPTTQPFDWSVVKEDEHITKMSLPPDDKMSTPDELFTAMNEYRKDNNIPQVQKDDTICSIAQNRANEQLANGGLDNHSGFDKYVQNQNEFSKMGEVLFGGTQPQYGVHIVEFGWNRSLTGHREAIRDSSWNYGCGGIAGYYAVFIFGTK